MKIRLKGDSGTIEAEVKGTGDKVFVTIGEKTSEFDVISRDLPKLILSNGGSLHCGYSASTRDAIFLNFGSRSYRFNEIPEDAVAEDSSHSGDLKVVAPMPGTVIKVLVEEGEVVARRQPLVIVEAMKMENEVRAPGDAKVGKIMVGIGDKVGFGQQLVELTPLE